MKITASRRDDVLKRQTEYEAGYQERQSRFDKQYGDFRTATKAVYDDIEAEIRSALGSLADGLAIDVSGSAFADGFTVKIRNNNGNIHGLALAWNWTASLESGEITKETNSWSGLDAVGAENLDQLKRTVQQLEVINNIDWDAVLGKAVPNYNDYVTDENPRYERKPNFKQELFEADVQDAIDNKYLIAGESYRLSGRSYYYVRRDAGSQYEVTEIEDWDVNKFKDNPLDGVFTKYDVSTLSELLEKFGQTYRIRKNVFMDRLYNPVETIPLD